MSINQTARAAALSSAPEQAPADVRTDKSRFYYEYALSYAKRAMRKGGNGKASKDPKHMEKRSSDSHDGIVRNRKTLRHYNGQRAAIDATTLERFDQYASEHEGYGSARWAEQLDSDARDIVQDAFMRWYESRVGGRLPLDTRGAVRFSVGEWRRSRLRFQRIRKRCSECRYADDACPKCEKRINKDKRKWANMQRPTAQTAAIRESMTEVADKPDPRMLVNDALPSLDGSKTRQQLQILIRWLASGAKQTEIAEYLHVGKQRITKLLDKLKDMFSETDFISEYRDTLHSAYGPQPEQRIYGDRPTGRRSETISTMLDMLDVFGHDNMSNEPYVNTGKQQDMPVLHDMLDRGWVQHMANQTETAEVIAAVADWKRPAHIYCNISACPKCWHPPMA